MILKEFKISKAQFDKRLKTILKYLSNKLGGGNWITSSERSLVKRDSGENMMMCSIYTQTLLSGCSNLEVMRVYWKTADLKTIHSISCWTKSQSETKPDLIISGNNEDGTEIKVL